MVYKLDHWTIEPNLTELLNLKLTDTTDVPSLAILKLKHRDDFNHSSLYANFFENPFTNETRETNQVLKCRPSQSETE